MEVQVKGMNYGIDVNGVVHSNGQIPTAFDNRDCFRIDRNTDFSDLLLDLPTNSSFIERRLLIIPRDALNLLLELIRLNIGWQDLPK